MLIALDAGHGGSDPGAVYNGRQEKDDNLRLALAVGNILENSGVDVIYTRNNDVYETPFKKATDANAANADFFVSFHRNSSENPNSASGVQNLIFRRGGKAETLAEDIQKELVDAGFNDLGIVERPNLVVLKRTRMPAVLIETGFINNTEDNMKFDNDFNRIAQAIADGILQGIGYGETAVNAAAIDMNGTMDDVMDSAEDMYENEDRCTCEKLYRVQVGAFRNRDNADRLLATLQGNDFPAFVVFDDGVYKVQVGAFRNLDNAVIMERRLRRYRFNTFITT